MLAAFAAPAVRGSLVRLPGGAGTSWRAGSLVLKPVVGAVEVEMLDRLAPVLLDVARAGPIGFRWPEPVPDRGGA